MEMDKLVGVVVKII